MKFLAGLVLLASPFFAIAQSTVYGLPLKARAIIDGISYKAVVNKDTSVSIISNNGKSTKSIRLPIDYSALWSFKFKDFNGDGFKDIVVEFSSNTPGDCDVYLYNHTLKNFTNVADIDRYPSPIKIPGTRYYYSYHHSGCADEDWDSDLFIIKNYKAICVGNISGNACDEKKPGVFVYRVKGKDNKLIKQFNIDIIKKYKSYKWGFIDAYWKRNYRKFA